LHVFEEVAMKASNRIRSIGTCSIAALGLALAGTSHAQPIIDPATGMPGASVEAAKARADAEARARAEADARADRARREAEDAAARAAGTPGQGTAGAPGTGPGTVGIGVGTGVNTGIGTGAGNLPTDPLRRPPGG
jgi:hypothetical protein